eukprot:2255878-Lingulodinium_polyedra.AAC.1
MVDDISVQVIGTLAKVASMFVPAMLWMVNFLQNELLLPVSMEKGAVLSSHPEALHGACAELSAAGVPFQPKARAKQLGVDYSPAKRRSTK